MGKLLGILTQANRVFTPIRWGVITRPWTTTRALTNWPGAKQFFSHRLVPNRAIRMSQGWFSFGRCSVAADLSCSCSNKPFDALLMFE